MHNDKGIFKRHLSFIAINVIKNIKEKTYIKILEKFLCFLCMYLLSTYMIYQFMLNQRWSNLIIKMF